MIDSSCVIRQAKLEDIDSIMQLIYLKAKFDGCPELLKATAAQLKQDLFGKNCLFSVLLAEVNGEAIGFATYHRIYSTFLAKPGIWLDDLFVKAAFRGQKIGRMLVLRLCEIAHETDCGRIDWTVAVSNIRGIQFYESIGATVQQKVKLCRLDREAIAQNAALAPSLLADAVLN